MLRSVDRLCCIDGAQAINGHATPCVLILAGLPRCILRVLMSGSDRVARDGPCLCMIYLRSQEHTIRLDCEAVRLSGPLVHFILVDRSAFHHEFYALELGDVF